MAGRRKTQRLTGYDYSNYGGYFITLCVNGRKPLFGEISNRTMITNHAGKMVQDIWDRIPAHYTGISIDEFQVMPDHIHGIVFIDHETVGAGHRARPKPSDESGRTRGSAPTDPLTLSDLIGRFKSFTTSRYITGVRDHGWAPFNGQLWQRGFHDRIIRDDPELFRIRRYISDNPKSFPRHS